MKKFFIVGKKNVLLGKETVKNKLFFTIGKNLSERADFAEVIKTKNDIFIQGNLNDENKDAGEEFSLLIKAINNNFKGDRIFIESRICESLYGLNQDKKLKSKYNSITDVYNNPAIVPWNFMSTEVEDVLSYFDKNILKNKKILYIGAGYGKNIWALEYNKNNYDIDAIEYSKIAADRANAFFGKKVVNHTDLLSLKNCKNKYDIVLDIGCLHCIPAKSRQQAVDVIHSALKDKGIIISRIFKPRDKKWLERMPFKISNFGLSSQEIKKLFSNKFIVKLKYENNDHRILEFKKC